MAVAFMAALEKAPESYDQKFDEVLEGRSRKIRERILELVTPGMKVLDLGCGPGQLVIEASMKGAYVIGVDSNAQMISLAKRRAAELKKAPEFIHGDILSIGENVNPEEAITALGKEPETKFDLITSTFLLSELKPVQRDLFMQIVRTMLADDGIIAIAAETLPESSSDRKVFWKNRGQVELDARIRLPSPIESLEEIAVKTGFSVDEFKKYGPEITLLICKESEKKPANGYQNRRKVFSGIKARLRIWYNHLTGSYRSLPITTGLYKVGNPTPESPVIVTANYELTYYTVLRALARDGIEAWVLVCDTNGINVWCAARGIHFDSNDVVQMVRLTELSDVVNHKELILPQLAAAGMNPPGIRKRTGFRVRYGPVRIQDLSEWMKLDKPRPKPRKMATVTFSLKERMDQTVAHIPFLFAAILAKPIAIILGILALANIGIALVFSSVFVSLFPYTLGFLLLFAEFILALAGNALVLGLIFPILPSKGNSFWRRGLGLAGITIPIAILIMFLLTVNWTTLIVWVVVQFMLAISLTMDWSGMTSVSDPKVIRREYPYMIQVLKFGTVFLVVFSIIVIIMGW